MGDRFVKDLLNGTEINWYQAVQQGRADDLFPDKETFEGSLMPRGKWVFQSSKPIARLEKGESGKLFLFTTLDYLGIMTGETVPHPNGFAYQTPVYAECFHVDDIGRRTRYEEEIVEGEQLIQLMNRQLIAKTKWWMKNYARHTAKSYDNNPAMRGYHISQIEYEVGRYNLFRREFCPGGEYPFGVGNEWDPVLMIKREIDLKMAKFNHPKAVEKRERAKARRLLDKALGH